MGDDGQQRRRGGEEAGGSEYSSAVRQWHEDNLPVEEKFWPEYQRTDNQRIAPRTPTGRNRLPSGDHPENVDTSTEEYFKLFHERSAVVALEDAFIALELPITLETAGSAQHHMTQLGLHFIFDTLPWLDDFRTGLAESGDLYGEEALAVQFYFKYGRALWGSKVGHSEVDQWRLQHLQSFFSALRAQHSVRSDFVGDGRDSLKYLVTFRQATMANISSATGEIDPNATKEDLFAALDIQGADTWVTTSLLHAIGQMAFDALDQTRDTPAGSFPPSRPSDAFVGSVARRIANRYSSKFWPEDYLKPHSSEAILQHFIRKILVTKFTRSDVIGDAVERLDGFLGLEDGDAEEARHLEINPPDEITGVECTLSHMETDESCSLKFTSATMLAAHLTEIHEFDAELAKEVASDSEREQQKTCVRW